MHAPETAKSERWGALDARKLLMQNKCENPQALTTFMVNMAVFLVLSIASAVKLPFLLHASKEKQ